jgi:threonine synthase
MINNAPEEDPNSRYYEYQVITYPAGRDTQFPTVGAGLEQFLPLLPIDKLLVSLNEGGTPISQFKSYGAAHKLTNLWVKHEEINPTGCFKDRESAIVISAAMEKGILVVHVASSGNAALSTAAYAQKAGIKCMCYVPQKTSDEKKTLIRLFGAELILVEGSYEDVYRHLVELDPLGWNVTTGQNAYRTEGDKTIAFEIWDQLGVPDVILVPCGNGGCLAGIWKGFRELYSLGKITSLPQMIAVQIKGAAPLSKALEEGSDYSILPQIADSIAEGIVALESYSSPQAILALQESGGKVIQVTDDEIMFALKQVIKLESLVTEPTSAAVFAAVPKLAVDPESKVLCINTGSGMKFLQEIAAILAKSKDD